MPLSAWSAYSLQHLGLVAEHNQQLTRMSNERKRAETLEHESILIQHVTLDMLKRAEAEREAVRKDAVEIQEACALLKDAWGLLDTAVKKLESERSVLAARS
ncbi:hypothetical protein KEM56_002588 [Ascosphaera pollenicola]|nr:hypothetical protein KEM56_002588 [Ascosphaera pollenicola]